MVWQTFGSRTAKEQNRTEPRPSSPAIVLDGDPLPPPRTGHSSLPSFWPMSTVATVVHLSYC